MHGNWTAANELSAVICLWELLDGRGLFIALVLLQFKGLTGKARGQIAPEPIESSQKARIGQTDIV